MIRPPPFRPPVTPILPKPPIHPINPGDTRSPFDSAAASLTTLNLKDRVTASHLESSLEKQLSSPIGQLQAGAAKETTLPRGVNGEVVGPEGQPLATVRLKDGRTAYVDPNTNQYYLADQPTFGPKYGGSVNVKGPLSLPADAQFSNSHFSQADVNAIGKIANTRPPLVRPAVDPFVDVFGR